VAEQSAKKPGPRKPQTLAETPLVAHEKRVVRKPAGIKGSFFLVLIASLGWGFMAGVSWAKLQELYAQGYTTFNNALLLLMVPFLMLALSLSLFWIVRTPKRNEVKPLAISSIFLWLVYFFWQAVLGGRLR
jgi:hypothetical protein